MKETNELFSVITGTCDSSASKHSIIEFRDEKLSLRDHRTSDIKKYY